MIRNLNRLSFSAYGRVLGEHLSGHGFPAGGQWIAEQQTITGKTELFCRCSNADVYMDYDQGMAVLLVTRNAAAGDVQAYYLDKPVCIDQGTYYCVMPFDESCTIHICTHRDARRETVRRPDNGALSVISANIHIHSIRTLFYQEKENGFFFKGEAHRQYELTYMDKGCMHSIVAGRDYVLSPGEMMLYGPNQWHSQFTEDAGRVCFITIAFDMDCEYADLLLNRKLQVDAAGAALLDGILREYRQADILSGDMICCRLMQFLLAVIRQVHRSEQGQSLSRAQAEGSENKLVDRALRHIAENIYEKLSVTQVARAVNVSPSYLSVLFTRHLKINPSDYIRREKLEEGKRLIKRGEMSFSQIADQLKFSSVCHFSAVFKKWTGVTPSEFSRSIAPNEALRSGGREGGNNDA